MGKNGGKIPGETSYMQGEIFKQRVLKSSSGQVFFGDSNGVYGVESLWDCCAQRKLDPLSHMHSKAN